jgi:hypothetical protein
MGYCYGQMAKKTSQTVEIGKAETLRLDVPNAKILWRSTQGKRIIIETSVELSVPNEALLNFIINNGRYELLCQINERTKQMVLSSKRNRNLLIIKGEECKEQVTYTIFVPPALRPTAQSGTN